MFFGLNKNKKEDKNQFLKAQKEAKAQREQAKHEQKCAIKIQAAYRGSRIRENVLKGFAVDRLKKLKDVEKLNDKLSPQQFALISNKLFQYKGLISFVVFLKPSNAKYHHDLVMSLGNLTLCSLEAEDNIFLNILSTNKEARLCWFVKLKHILLALLEISYGRETLKNGMQDFFSERVLAERLLEKILKINDKTWNVLEKALSKNSSNLDTSLRKEIKQNIKQVISSEVIQNIINSPQFKQSSFLRNFALKTAPDRNNIKSGDMFVELLGLQTFYNDLLEMNQNKKRKLIHFLIKQIESQIFQKSQDFKFLEKFINEVIGFLHFALTNNVFEGFEAEFFSNVFSVLSVHIETFQNALFSLPQNKKIIYNTMEIEEEKGSPTIELSPHKKTKYLKEIIDKEPSMGLTLGQNGVQIFCENISNIFTIFKAADFDIFSNLVADGCNLLLKFQRSLSSHDKMLCENILSFKLNFYYLPFMCLKRQGYNVKSILFVPEKYIPIIKVFSKVLYQTLRITDDEEFLGNNEIIQSSWLLIEKEEIIEIAQFTNYLLFNVIWNRIVAFYSIISSQVKLIRELHIRDTRLKYCPKDFWVIPELVKVSEQMLSDPDQLKVEAHQDILNKVPHMLPFETRLKILFKQIEFDKENYDRVPGFDPEYDLDDLDDLHEDDKDPKVVTIQRQFLLEDGFQKILKRKDMRSIFMIRFINEHGIPEEGIDGGGLLKEFITLISKIAFDANYGLFVENEDKTLMPNPNSYLVNDHLNLFKFIGRLTGKAIYEHILLESVFSVIFLNRILKVPNTINELKYADPTLYKNLILLKHKNDVADKLNLTFSIDEVSFGKPTTIPLKVNGDQIEVNESNKLEYISLFCNYKLNLQIDKQSQAFFSGLKSTIDPYWIKLFNHEELQIVISGIKKKGFSVPDMKANVEYKDFTPTSLTIKYFWEVLEEMSDDERSLFLHFVTGCSRPPTLGFKSMTPKIAIHNFSYSAEDSERLPTSSTCANLFKLPDYKDKELLRSKILYAINSNAGFDLG